ncbi:hypothetical protein DW66_3053 [Pseudomonas putida]|nr:conserved hypothetical protein [Pseudomonas putida S16]AHZ77562.1 hypothetical protein DW66_3053 [Pseudomonas putida]AJG13387.1 hypothetical protein RK21_01879 [Pseudomonas plecoglossicida]
MLGVGGVVFAATPAITSQPAGRPGFVVINGWVLPSRYFRNEHA